jgi:hypothetical protein
VLDPASAASCSLRRQNFRSVILERFHVISRYREATDFGGQNCTFNQRREIANLSQSLVQAAGAVKQFGRQKR